MNQQSKTIIGIVVAVVVVLGGYLLFNKSADAPGSSQVADTGPIKIGVLQPLTGDIASIGINIASAVELAANEVNEAGGINGRQVEVIAEDSACDPTKAVNGATKLLNVDKVIAIVGGGCSSETLAVAPLAEAVGVPLVSPVSTNPDITDAGDFIFRFVPSDAFQGKFAADYLREDVGAERVAIMYCLSDWCVGVKDVFADRAAETGIQVVAEEGYPQDTTDLRSQISKVKATNPDAVYFLGYTKASVAGLRQLKELGLDVPVLGGDTWLDEQIPKEAGEAAYGAQFSSAAGRELPEDFVAALQELNNGQEVDSYTPRGYDITKKLLEIVAEVGTDGEAIKAALYDVAGYEGIADVYTIDENGDMDGGSFEVKEFGPDGSVSVSAS